MTNIEQARHHLERIIRQCEGKQFAVAPDIEAKARAALRALSRTDAEDVG